MRIADPDLLADPTFHRCYQRWVAQPTSAAFVGVADLLRACGRVADAIEVCREGLRHQPQLITARLILARCLLAQNLHEHAHALVLGVLREAPKNHEALDLARELAEMGTKDESVPPDPSIVHPPSSSVSSLSPITLTLTLGRLYAAQGHVREAQTVFQQLLYTDPANREAAEALARLPARSSADSGERA